MKKLTADDPETKSPDIKAENIATLRTLFPELVTEGANGVAVNIDVLKQLVGDKTVTDADEKYGLNWHGKKLARQLALTPSTGTLRPCPEESVDWDTTQNLMIEGDNLEVLKLLQKSYAGKVKLIYIDPPYNTGKDFVYPDNFQDSIKNYLELTGQTDEGGKKLSANTEASGRFHTDWLNMMYPRLKLARNLLREDGALLVSIGDREVGSLLALMNDIFGEENQIGVFSWKSRAKPTNAGDAKFRVQRVAEYIIAYGRKPGDELLLNVNSSKTRTYPHEDVDGKYRTTTILTSNRGMFRRETMRFEAGGYKPDEDNRWKAGKVLIDDLFRRNRISFNDDGIPIEKKYEHEETDPLYPVYSFVDPDLTGTAEDGKSDLNELVGNQHGLDTVKPVQLLKYLTSTFTDKCDLIMDFFAGSGTTGQSLFELNIEDISSRKFILVQFPEPMDSERFPTIADITKERLCQAGKKIKRENPLFSGDLGFRVFKLASSNIRAWNSDRNYLAYTLEASIEHLKSYRTDQDILFELLLKLGLDLCVPIETKRIEEGAKQVHEIHSIGGGSLFVCLSSVIPLADVERLALGLVAWHQDLKPAGDTTIVFRDSAFADDVAKTNLTAILQQYGLENVRSI